MKCFFLLVLSLFSTFGSGAFGAYTCSKSCDSQCKVGFLGNNVEPVCFSGCKAWQLAKCYDISDPYVSTMGEFGKNAYPASAGIMTQRNPIWTNLDQHEKAILRPLYGNLVDRIRLHLKSNLMSTWGDPPYQVRFFNDAGQTYGHDVYIKYYRTDIDRVDRLILIGHELCHSRQYEARGSSFQNFGRDYFEGFAKKGGYANNPMEVECDNMEAKVQTAATKYWAYFDQHVRKWNFEVCNESDYDNAYVAIGWPHKLENGFSLVPMRVSKGWYTIPKGQCKTLLTNLDSDAGIDAYATSAAAGGWATWGGANGPQYCVHPTNAFDIGSHYNCAAGEEKVSFRYIDNPWRAFNSGTYKWRLTGKATRLKICNQSGKVIDAALLRGDHGPWRSEGWYVFQNGQCRDWNFGPYTGSLYIYGENQASGVKWTDASKPSFCAYHGTAFEHEQVTPCFTTKGGFQVKGFETTLTPGQNQWNFRP